MFLLEEFKDVPGMLLWMSLPPPFPPAALLAAPSTWVLPERLAAVCSCQPASGSSCVTHQSSSPAIPCHPPSRVTCHLAANLSKEKDASGNAEWKPTPHPWCLLTRISLGRKRSQGRQPQLHVLQIPSLKAAWAGGERALATSSLRAG